mmetsp:Transcript_45233/g.114527  ORF Transcript_45233/g.114527 Transcript_45233/m.114527 type:complete len:344 (-) Transcript_45233:82-1113(-)|eukprot:jgi/Tetstr1/453050/TSEL_040086.t1
MASWVQRAASPSGCIGGRIGAGGGSSGRASRTAAAALRHASTPPPGARHFRISEARSRSACGTPRVAESRRWDVGGSYYDDEDDDDELPADATSPIFRLDEDGFHASKPCKYNRVMLKLSGEALQGGLGFGVDPAVLRTVARDIAECQMRGLQMAVVVGGGNYFRGVDAWEGLDRATADYVGMMATCMNAICLQSALEDLGVPTRVQTAIEMKEIAEPYIRRKAVAHLNRGRVVIFGAGTGNPFFTTDTAAALRAAEIGADVLMKATKVDGVYDSDPVLNPEAVRFDKLTYEEVAARQLGVMDETAITLCKENRIPVLVFALEEGNVVRAVFGDDIGTTVEDI